MRRRMVLATLGTGLVALAGCNNCGSWATMEVTRLDTATFVDRFLAGPGREGQRLARRIVRNGTLRRSVTGSDDRLFADGARVQVEDTYYRIQRAENGSNVTYRAEMVAPNRTAFLGQLVDQHGFRLDLDSEAQRSVFQQAIEQGKYKECGPARDSAFASVIDRLVSHDPYEVHVASRTWIVRYDGRLYEIRLKQVVSD